MFKHEQKKESEPSEKIRKAINVSLTEAGVINEGEINVTLNQILAEIRQVNNRGKELLNFEEAAEFLDVAPGTLYKMTSKGQIPHAKFGKRLSFKKDVLLGWVNQQMKYLSAA